MSNPAETDSRAIELADQRVARWQSKLLDLTLRNRLLNFKATLQTVPLICDDICHLEDQLSDNQRLKVTTRPDRPATAESTVAPVNPNLREPEALNRQEIYSTLPEDQLHKQLTRLYRSTRNDLSEGGSNTLFLAVGFLHWKRNARDQRFYRAPLLLVPVKLNRLGSKSPFHLQQHEDEPRFNATLIQMLKRDFGKDLGQFEAGLPKDDQGIDVPHILNEVSACLDDISFMQTVDESALGRFSFAKYLLWKDLVDRTDQLKSNRVVRHLLETNVPVFTSNAPPIPAATQMDELYSPHEIFHPLDADSSQLSAIVAASNGNDFVLVGPPGTGKSQTIANIISQCLALGKTVLFVAEKNAALNVVHSRLVEAGLESCCVELHSNKADRKTFLKQLKHNWESNQQSSDASWESKTRQLKRHRDHLNDYAHAMNKRLSNGWSAFDAFWESTRRSDLPTIEFDWSGFEQHSVAIYQKTEATLKRISDGYETIALDPPLPMLTATDWSLKWESDLLKQSQTLIDASADLKNALKQFATVIGIEESIACSIAQLENIGQLAASIIQCEQLDTQFMQHPQFDRFPDAADQLQVAIDHFRNAKKSLSVSYDDSFHKIPLEDLETQWRQACKKFWPMSWFAKRHVQRRLRVYADLETLEAPDTVADLKAIRTITEQMAAIGNSLLADQINGWRDQDTDAAAIKILIEKAHQFSQSIGLVEHDHHCSGHISTALSTLTAGQQTAFNSQIVSRGGRFQSFHAGFTAAIEAFEELASGSSKGASAIFQDAANACHAASQTASTVIASRGQIKRWTLWCRLRSQAKILGVAHAIKQLESNTILPGEIPTHFRNSYARWLVPNLVDRTPALRNFETRRHEQTIAQFQDLDSDVRKLTSNMIRAKIAHGLPQPEDVAKKSELGLLRHQMGLKRPSKSIRDIVTGMPNSFSALAPCLLMSPLSIAQYLPADQNPFDVVIFDEASQITTWDAIGAIARGKQTVVVGDPQQLPPTNFFSRQEHDDDLDGSVGEAGDVETGQELLNDAESILEEAVASGLPKVNLNWHYRSRHESLITFSNLHYYQNRLLTFPSATPQNNGISLTKVSGAYYDRGKTRTNLMEAEAIVDEAVRLMREQLALPAAQRDTLGVVTFNTQQQTLIEDLFDHQISQHPEIQWYFSDDRDEPTVVKNLENVQGDERDVIFFSITFGPTDSNSRVSLNFGAINRASGYRRLNVAITRARQQMRVFASFDPNLLSSSNNRGPNDLKNFLLFADSNTNQFLGDRPDSASETKMSALEAVVGDALTKRGWKTVIRIGSTEGGIVLAIIHPRKPEEFLAGVICDGASPLSGTARDREITRLTTLNGLGWNIVRVWSEDWWHNPQTAADRMHQQLSDLIDPTS